MAYGRAISDRVALARALAARSRTRFIEIKRERKRWLILSAPTNFGFGEARNDEHDRTKLAW